MRPARPTSSRQRRRPASGGSCTSRPRSATGCTRSSSRSRSTTRCGPRTRATRSPRPPASTTSRLSGLDWVSLRLANAYGPRNVSGPLPTFFHRLTEGKPCFVMDTRRDFIFVEDLIDLVVAAIDGQGSSGVYHASSGSDFSIKELFDATVAALGSTSTPEVEVRDARRRRRLHDPARPVPHHRGLRLEAEDAARARASPTRSPTTASTGSRRPTRT